MSTQTAVFGGGCFWCTEAAFQDLKGVVRALPGYAGGYPAPVLRGWARWLCEQAKAGRPSFAYFNNDTGGAAVRDARTLSELLLERGLAVATQ